MQQINVSKLIGLTRKKLSGMDSTELLRTTGFEWLTIHKTLIYSVSKNGTNQNISKIKKKKL